MRSMRKRVRLFDVSRWADSFLAALRTAPAPAPAPPAATRRA